MGAKKNDYGLCVVREKHPSPSPVFLLTSGSGEILSFWAVFFECLDQSRQIDWLGKIVIHAGIQELSRLGPVALRPGIASGLPLYSDPFLTVGNER